MRHFCLNSCPRIGEKMFSWYNRCEIFTCMMLSLYKAMIWFIRLVDLPILSCLCEAFAMSREIKNDLLNLQEYLIVGETSPSSTKVEEEMWSKYQKKKIAFQVVTGKFEHINRGWGTFCSHIPIEDYMEGLNALKTTGNGSCLYNFASVLIQGYESANLLLGLSVNNAFHNKWVIYFKLPINLVTAFVNDNFWYINLLK